MLRLLVAVVCILSVIAYDCTWTDPESGWYYDFNPLRYQNYAGTDVDGRTYVARFCGFVDSLDDCKKVLGGVCVTDKEGLHVVGKLTADPQPEWRLMDRRVGGGGARIHFDNGDLCHNYTVPRVDLNVECNPMRQDTYLAKVVEYLPCAYSLTLIHSAGCGTEPPHLRHSNMTGQ